jgi:hypothetical protein
LLLAHRWPSRAGPFERVLHEVGSAVHVAGEGRPEAQQGGPAGTDERLEVRPLVIAHLTSYSKDACDDPDVVRLGSQFRHGMSQAFGQALWSGSLEASLGDRQHPGTSRTLTRPRQPSKTSPLSLMRACVDTAKTDHRCQD